MKFDIKKAILGTLAGMGTFAFLTMFVLMLTLPFPLIFGFFTLNDFLFNIYSLIHLIFWILLGFILGGIGKLR